jgi:hypothetical protein
VLSGQVLATRIFGGSPPRSRLQELAWELVASVGVVVKLNRPTWSSRFSGSRGGYAITSSPEFRKGGMQLSRFLGLCVTVVDVRLAVAGEPAHNPPNPRVLGLVISPRTASSYLGYERTNLNAPVLLAALFRWRHRGTFLAAWQDIARVAKRQVTLPPGYTRYAPAPHDSGLPPAV